MLGQFLGVPDDAEPAAVLKELELVGPDELVEVVPTEGEVVVAAVVAASATMAPPAMRPLVNAPAAITLRRRSFMAGCPSLVIGRWPPHGGEQKTLCATELWLGLQGVQSGIRNGGPQQTPGESRVWVTH